MRIAYALVLVVGCSLDEERAGELYGEGRALMPMRPEAAAAKLEESVRLDPTRHEAQGLLAEARLALGDAAGAKRAALAAIEIRETAGYRETLGRAHLALGEKRPALTALRRALALDRARHALHFDVGELEHELGDDAAAERSYRAAIAASVRPVDSRLALASIIADRDRVEAHRLLVEAVNESRGGEMPPPFRELAERLNYTGRSGGTGEGTIGLGNLGTIGHGGGPGIAGTGSDVAPPRPSAAPPP